MDNFDDISCEEFFFTEECSNKSYRYFPDEDLIPFGEDEAED